MHKKSLQELASLTQAQLVGDPLYLIAGVADLDSATPEEASFLANRKYETAMQKSAAGVICVHPQTPLAEGKNYLVSEDPSRAFQIIVELFLNRKERESGFAAIHPTAVIHPSVQLGQDVRIGPYVVIDQGCVIGDRTHIEATVCIAAGVKIGSDCHFYSHVTIREGCIIGNRVILQPGAVIGSCGFGYTTDEKGKHHKLEQVGIVILEDDVEVGANTTIDRARFKTTTICQGTKIDNLVQIGHNVTLGPNNIIVSQSGIAGSAKTGKNVVMGGQAGIVGHLEITDYVMIATRGGVSKSITRPGKYAGSPVMPLAEYNRQQVQLRNINKWVEELETLKNK
jgi:UDP-3-O-[3-hydroxymyristoyl] glucosamine N-acyltransferase